MLRNRYVAILYTCIEKPHFYVRYPFLLSIQMLPWARAIHRGAWGGSWGQEGYSVITEVWAARLTCKTIMTI